MDECKNIVCLSVVLFLDCFVVDFFCFVLCFTPFFHFFSTTIECHGQTRKKWDLRIILQIKNVKNQSHNFFENRKRKNQSHIFENKTVRIQSLIIPKRIFIFIFWSNVQKKKKIVNLSFCCAAAFLNCCCSWMRFERCEWVREGSDVEDDQSNFLPKRKIFQRQTKTRKNMREKKSLRALEIFLLKLLVPYLRLKD